MRTEDGHERETGKINDNRAVSRRIYYTDWQLSAPDALALDWSNMGLYASLGRAHDV